jgi:hypothetical protein
VYFRKTKSKIPWEKETKRHVKEKFLMVLTEFEENELNPKRKRNLNE